MVSRIFHPSPVAILSLLRLFSALPFAVFYSSLELYLINIGFQNSTALVGSVLALSFGLSLLGGYLGGHYLRYKSLFLLSVLFQAIGCLVFSTHNHGVILWLSSLFLLGSIGNTICMNMMLTQLFQSGDHRREKAFFILYLCLNLGYLIGYSLSGHFANINQYSRLPPLILITSCTAFFIILFFWKKLDTSVIAKQKKNILIKIILIFCTAFLLLRLLLGHPYTTNILLILSWVLLAIYMYFHIVRNFHNKTKEIRLFYVLLFSALVFWSVYFLAPMALMVFIKYYVDLNIGNFLIAPQWIQNINTLIVIGGSIWFSLNIKDNSDTYLKKQFAKGLLLMGAGFLVLTLGIILQSDSTHINIVWVVLSYVLQSSGELFIGPIGYSLVGKLIPNANQSIMTGIWATILGVASAIASFLSSSILPSGQHLNISLNKFNHLFIVMSTLTICVSILLFLRENTSLQKI